MKVLSLRRDDVCALCDAQLPAGTRANWDSASKRTTCLECAGSAVPRQPVPVQTTSVAGRSAQQEYERRSAKREQIVRERHPRLGGLMLALFDDPSSTRVWAQGAAGERAVGQKLDELTADGVISLHDRAVPNSRANIDHIAITASGVWVVDAKTHKGQLEVRRSGGLLGPRTEKLYIGGRDKTSLLAGLQKQVDLVRIALVEADAPIPVRGALCFYGTELPWFGEMIGGVPLVGRRGLAKLLKKAGSLTAEDCGALAAYLAGVFPQA